MSVNPLAGRTPTALQLVNVPRLVTSYYVERPDPACPTQRVVFGTSGHRGSPLNVAFNEWHILAITLIENTTGLEGHCSWGRILMRFLNPLQQVPSKSWRQMAST